MKPRVAFLTLMLSVAAAAEQDLAACADGYADCHDSCSLRYGTSTRDTDRVKLAKCIGACQKGEQSCRDRYIETNVHQLDEGAVKHADKHDDDVREDTRKKPADDEKPPPARTATRAAELDPKPEAKAEPKPEPKPEPVADKRAEKPAEKKPEAPAPGKKKSSRAALDEWDPEAL